MTGTEAAGDAPGGRVLLEARGLSAVFGGLRALDAVDLEVTEGEIAALIGPNGAGKTTFFNCLTGLCLPSAGELHLVPAAGRRRRLDGLSPNRITALGVARTFQNIRLFPEMTALENVMVGRHVRTRAGVFGALLRGPKTRAEERGIAAAARDLLAQVGLRAVADEPAASLPYGLQRRLEIARALATRPLLLLLDEPAAGMNPRETAELDELIRRLRDEEGVTILLIEHDMRLVMGLAEKIVVLDYGRLIAAGTPAQIRADPEVIRAYLGEQR
ncbi:MAG: ABC transporter ATP-binding protein [Candidatus Methylomirabilia bacterium]